ncbi:MAG: ERF family protein [Elusimicrobia bacterium]|nr:ERF family protein [Elusimicrobiota bacterium]
MSVHKKLMDARIKLQNMPLKKSGVNKFSNYDYFELGDFLPQTQQIFAEVGLCGTVSFSAEKATLCVTDGDSGYITFECPMATAALKGCHDVQNLGASMTYIRRYLWVNALEIVEHDSLDATTGSENKGKGVHKPTANELFQPDEEELKYLNEIVEGVKWLKDDYAAAADLLAGHNLDADEKTWIWDKLDSKVRSGIKKYNQELKEKEGK